MASEYTQVEQNLLLFMPTRPVSGRVSNSLKRFRKPWSGGSTSSTCHVGAGYESRFAHGAKRSRFSSLTLGGRAPRTIRSSRRSCRPDRR
jgi:hypothetical protein